MWGGGGGGEVGFGWVAVPVYVLSVKHSLLVQFERLNLVKIDTKHKCQMGRVYLQMFPPFL